MTWARHRPVGCDCWIVSTDSTSPSSCGDGSREGDIASGDSFESHESPIEFAPELEAEAEPAEEAHSPCNCGCAHCKETMTLDEDSEEELLEDADDTDPIDETTPFVWDDIREALEDYRAR